MTASGRSIKAINELENELKSAIDALFFLFGCTVLAVGTLVILSLKLRLFGLGIAPRVGQAVVVATVAMVFWRAGQIPAILRRTLAIRRDIAVAEARRDLAEKAPEAGAVRQSFATHPEFGKVISLRDLDRPQT
nr:hypothetical protein [uncultured Roseococcus sp.]